MKEKELSIVISALISASGDIESSVSLIKVRNSRYAFSRTLAALSSVQFAIDYIILQGWKSSSFHVEFHVVKAAVQSILRRWDAESHPKALARAEMALVCISIAVELVGPQIPVEFL